MLHDAHFCNQAKSKQEQFKSTWSAAHQCTPLHANPSCMRLLPPPPQLCTPAAASTIAKSGYSYTILSSVLLLLLCPRPFGLLKLHAAFLS